VKLIHACLLFLAFFSTIVGKLLCIVQDFLKDSYNFYIYKLLHPTLNKPAMNESYERTLI